jgi:uncharacterized paraquat-inducible protein A
MLLESKFCQPCDWLIHRPSVGMGQTAACAEANTQVLRQKGAVCVV